MRAVVVDGGLGFRPDHPERERPGEARLTVLRAGICNTDLEIVRGYMGFQGVPGHEFVGEVLQAPLGEWVGRRVVGEINAACGRCATCLRGDGRHCPERTVLGILGRDGAFAEHLWLPLENLHPLPDEVSDEEAVFVEPLAAALEILDQTHVRPTERVVVLGDGKLGQLVVGVLRLTGCELHVVGRHPSKLARLPAGVAGHLEPEAAASNGALMDALMGADVVVDCTGSPEGLRLARRLVRPRGRLVMKSTFHGLTELDTSRLVVDEVTLLGSRCGPFEAAIRLLERGLVDVRPLLDETYPLSEGEAAFAHAADPGVLKVQLQVSG